MHLDQHQQDMQGLGGLRDPRMVLSSYYDMSIVGWGCRARYD